MSRSKDASTLFADGLRQLDSSLDYLIEMVIPDADTLLEISKVRTQLESAGFFTSLDLDLLRVDTDEPYDAAASSLRYGIAHLLAAEVIHPTSPDTAWYCLLRCQEQFGRAEIEVLRRSGLETAQRKGSMSRQRNLDSAKAFAAQLLKNAAVSRASKKPALPRWQDPSEAATSIQADFERYILERSIALKPSQLHARLVYWIRSQDEVRAAFEDYCTEAYRTKSRRRKERKAHLDSQFRMLT